MPTKPVKRLTLSYSGQAYTEFLGSTTSERTGKVAVIRWHGDISSIACSQAVAAQLAREFQNTRTYKFSQNKNLSCRWEPKEDVLNELTEALKKNSELGWLSISDGIRDTIREIKCWN